MSRTKAAYQTTRRGAPRSSRNPYRCARLRSGSSRSERIPEGFASGIHLGDIIIGQDDDIFGDGVNIAVRLEGIAEPGGICISESCTARFVARLTRLRGYGRSDLKNIAEPMRAWRVRIGSSSPATKTPTETAQPLALPDKPSIAVLPFENMSGDPEQEYFADGMVEEIITALSRFKSLFVIARNSSFTFKGQAVDIKEVGRRLGVRYVLEGSVRKASGKVRITGQLIDAVTGAHLWADRFERDLTDVFALQDDVTVAVVSAIQPKIASNRNCNGDAAATGEPHRL